MDNITKVSARITARLDPLSDTLTIRITDEPSIEEIAVLDNITLMIGRRNTPCALKVKNVQNSVADTLEPSEALKIEEQYVKVRKENLEETNKWFGRQ